MASLSSLNSIYFYVFDNNSAVAGQIGKEYDVDWCVRLLKTGYRGVSRLLRLKN